MTTERYWYDETSHAIRDENRLTVATLTPSEPAATGHTLAAAPAMLDLLRMIDEWWREGDAPIHPSALASTEQETTMRDAVRAAVLAASPRASSDAGTTPDERRRFTVHAGDRGSPDGACVAGPFDTYEFAEGVADGYRAPGRWASVHEEG